MRILHCTDFHGNRHWFDWLADQAAGFDLVCLTGDHLDAFQTGRIKQQRQMVETVWRRITVPLALCSGNHDSFDGPPAPPSLIRAAWLQKSRRQGVWADGDSFELQGRHFRCIGWNALLPARGGQEIWLFHAPPWGTPVSAGRDGDDFGDQNMAEQCKAGLGPGLVLSGHQHNPRRWACRLGRTWCFNPGYAHDASVPNHIVIDTSARVATFHAAARQGAKLSY